MRSQLDLLSIVLLCIGACSTSGGEGGGGGGDAPASPAIDGGGGDGAVQPTRAEFGLDTRPPNPTCAAPARPPAAGPVKLEQVYTNVKLERPMMMAMAPNDTSRWYVGLRDGRIVRFPVNAPPDTPELVASTSALAAKPIYEDFEGGWLGMAFHPNFAQNGRLYVYFTTDGDNGNGPYGSEVGYLTSPDNGATFTSFTRVLHFDRPKLEHNGGGMAFGKDGYLYIGFGDATDNTNAQNKDVFFGKVVRIDVTDVPAGKTYGIPPDNPFANGGGRPEIFAYGFRNPFRISIDRETGDLWLGDVGDAQYEEINKVALGANHGWPCREGFHDKYIDDPAFCPNPTGLVDPIVELPHAPTPNSRSVTGGIVYRGAAMPALHGTYFFADFIRLEAWSLTFDVATGEASTALINADGPQAGFSAFAEDDKGEIYALALFQDSVFKLVPNGQQAPSTFPDRLSKTGCVDPADPRRPAAGLVPFDVSSPLWSDGAEKQRWMALPDGKTIDVKADGDFDFPVGTVLMKTFSLQQKPVETRLLIRHDDGEWAGYSYEWSDDGSDAALLPAGKSKPVGGQVWTFPGRADCPRCHTKAAGRSLGPELGQLNGDGVYPSTNRIANQLATLDHIGMFSAPLGKKPADIVAYPGPSSDAPLEARARAYLHANCAGCHRPEGGAARSAMDLRFATPLAETKTCNVDPQIDALGVAGAKLIAPGAPAKSIVSLRPKATDSKRMPPLGTRIVHAEGTGLIDAWIGGLTACP